MSGFYLADRSVKLNQALVFNQGLSNFHYVPLDQVLGMEITQIQPHHLRQGHYVACIVRDGADKYGLVLGAFKKARSEDWERLTYNDRVAARG